MARYGWAEQYFDDSGSPLAGGLLYFYEPGTTTPKTTYSDTGQTTPNANPVVLDAAGRMGDVFYTGSAKLVIKTSAGVTLETVDPVGGDSLSASEVKTLYESNADTNEFSDAEQTKLSGIETAADVTDETNVVAALSGATLTDVAAASDDKILIQDTSDSDNLKTIDVSDLSGFTWSEQTGGTTAALGDAMVFTGLSTDVTLNLPATFSVGDSPILVINANTGTLNSSVDITPQTSDDLHFGYYAFGSSEPYSLYPGEAMLVVPKTDNQRWALTPLFLRKAVMPQVDLGSISGSTTENIDINFSGSYYAAINGTSVTLNLTTSHNLGDANYEMSGTVFVYLTATATGLSASSDVTGTTVYGTAPTASGDEGLLRWYYSRQGANERMVLEWVS